MNRFAARVILLLLLVTTSTVAQERSVWSIGKFDGSSAEFNQNPVPADRVFVVRTNQPGDWAGTQLPVLPGKEAPAAKLRFDLPDAPRGMFTLKLGSIIKSARVPVVQIDVNGRKGRFHQHLATDFEEGNIEGAILPQYSIGVVKIDIPAEFLRQGTNDIGLTMAADPHAAILPGGDILDATTFIYDALELINKPAAASKTGILTAEATPTVFYRREGDRLAEVVSVLVRWNRIAPQGSVSLTLPGWNRTQTLTSDHEFGEQRFEFVVPEFAKNSQARINVSANDRTYEFMQRLEPARKWTVHMVPHEHLDIGYSDFQSKLAELHSRVIDDAMQMSREHPEFSFSLDGSWQAQQFLEGRSEVQRQQLYQAIQDKKIRVPAQHSVMLTGFATAESLLRSFYGSHKMNREHGGAWDYANATDVPSYTWSYASILAASGIKYFAAAANADRGPILMLGDLHRRSPFWWEGPDGSRVLMWYARHYHQIGSEFGLPTQIASGYEGLPGFLRVYDRPDYPSNSVLLHGSQWENTSLFPQQARLAKEWNREFAYPELRFSGFAEAIEAAAGANKDKLPVIRGDGAPFWEDGIASDAAAAALERETERRTISAEKLGALASLVDPRFQTPRAALADVWENINLMNEHTWGWGRSVTEPFSEDSTRELAVKRQFGIRAHEGMEYVLDRSMTALAGSIETPQRALVVFNTLNWERDGWVALDLQKTRELVDVETNQQVSVEVLQDHPAYQRIRFIAHGVPAVGYKTYEVRDKVVSVSAQTANQAGDPVSRFNTSAGIIQNPFYRITLDPNSGVVRSIYDKQLGRELVDAASPYRFNQYVYVTGGDDFPNQLLTYRKSAPFARLQTHPADGGKLLSISKTPSGIVAHLESRGVNTPKINTEIILFDDEKKIEFVNRVVKETVYKKEAAYFAFPLAMRDPRFNFEVQTGVVDPAKDMMPGANREWFSSQNWMSVSDAGAAVGIVNKDSFLWTFGDIVRGTWTTDFRPANATAFSYVMNNYWNTNYIAAQGGEFTFRYVLTSDKSLDSATLGRLGWQETTPLERILIKSQDQTFPARKSLPAAEASLLRIDNTDVVLSALKEAENGDGYIMRFIELSGNRKPVSVTSPLLQSATARACDAMEECGERLPTRTGGFSFEARPRGIITTRVTPARVKE